MTKTKPKRELRRFAPQLSFGFNVLTYLAMAIGAISLVIVDKMHLSLAPSYLKILSYFPEALILGVTATPSRLVY